MTTKEKIAKRLFMDYDEVNNVYDKKFKGFIIQFIPSSDKFYLLGKETLTDGCLTWEVAFEDCSKPVKIYWMLIQKLIALYEKDFGIEGYGEQIGELLIRMYYKKTHKIPDDGRSSGNMYRIAEKYYKQIVKELK